MTFLCGLRRGHHDSDDKVKPTRSRTMSIFGNSNPTARAMLRGFIGVTVKPWEKTPQTPDESSDGSFTQPSQPSDNDVYMSTDMRDTLRAVYNNLRGKNDLLPKDTLAAFLRGVQGLPSVQLDKDFYNEGEFIFVLVKDSSLDAVKPPAILDLSQPLTNYFISSSHNTYLVGNQLSSRSSPDAYTTALLRGCRCIEIDVYNGDAVVPTTGSRSPKVDHSRTISANSVSNLATSIHDHYDDARSLLADKTASTHSRSPSTHSRAVFDDVSPRTSLQLGPDPKDSAAVLGLDTPSRSRSHSRSMPRGEPKVMHGWTLTAPCGFREVCEAIRDSAFVNSDLPIIISLQVDADFEQQEVMVKIMKEVWGSMLVQEPHQGYDPQFRVPTLGELRNKILIKVKKAPAKVMHLHHPHHHHDPNDPDHPSSSPAVFVDEDNPDSSSSDVEDPAGAPKHTVTLETGPPPANPAKVAICHSLGKLAVYTRSEKFRSLDQREAKHRSHIFSVGEKKILELHHKSPRELFAHNKNYFMRAYPDGLRINSSNPDPSLFWRKGVQMVAMNWQNMDEGMMLNEGMFADEQGWVLKPSAYRSSDRGVGSQEQAVPYRTLNLIITVYAGQHVQPPENTRSGTIHPIVKAELHAENDTGDDSLYKQKSDARETDHPHFGHDGAVLKFLDMPKVVEELSLIRFKIEDQGYGSAELISWACIRLDRLLEGYRFIRLKDPKGNPIAGGKLLVKVEKTLR